ncbi:MAG: type II secretion system GspH family protein [Muribaculaceae bacterium]|nr:type II secretion system GspH family protein [Muribaculaceae bacterium]
MKQKGFTLAEVLITLGIIGIVAAMTIPNLITNYKANQLRSKFLKSYSLLTQVLRSAQEDDFYFVEKREPGYSRYQQVNVFKKYLTGYVDCGDLGFLERRRLSKFCLLFMDENDYYNGYKTLTSSKLELIGKSLFDDGQLLLPDGTQLIFNSDGHMVGVHIDLNGFSSPPNRWGYDLFSFQLKDDNYIPMGDFGTKYTDKNRYCNLESSDPLNGIACASEAKSNADYFKWVVKNVK